MSFQGRRHSGIRPFSGPVLATLALAVTALALALALAPVPAAAKAKPLSVPWPPPPQQGTLLFAHFGEEHINDADGGTLLPKVVSDVARYRPNLVTMSGDKANDGEPEQLGMWLAVMRRFDRAGIPWFAAVGNHDRKAPPGFPGGVSPLQDFAPYRDFFAGRPWPMGDAAPYQDPRIRPRPRPAADPEGAATHYFVDYANVRWIFIDNSCWSIVVCDTPGYKVGSGQQQGDEAQFDFLARVASQARDQGRHAFVVMHMPTQDPRDQSYAEPTSVMHTMGKGPAGLLDNTTFEQTVAEAGVDGVFVAHIKGQFRYRGEGGVPYFVDGGAGGELYTTGPIGVDHGYWHGFRLVRVRGERIGTDVVPIFVPGGIRIEGPGQIGAGEVGQWEAFGRQPVFNDPAKVESLELRDPDPVVSSGPLALGPLGAGVWAILPLALLLAVGIAVHRRAVAAGGLAVGLALLIAGGSVAGVSLAQQSAPTSTPREALPNPARIWTSSNPAVLRPVAAEREDGRRKRATQTAGGRFRGACPGRAQLEIASGWSHRQRTVRVRSRRGPIVRSIGPGARVVKRGRARPVARVRLAQPARVRAVIRSGGRRIATLRRGCLSANRPLPIRWSGRRARGGRGKLVKPGAYRLVVTVLSDRKPRRRSFRLVVR